MSHTAGHVYSYTTLGLNFSTYSVMGVSAPTYALLNEGPTTITRIVSGVSTSSATINAFIAVSGSVSGSSTSTGSVVGLTGLSSSASGTSSSVGSAQGDENYTFDVQGVSTSTGTARGTALIEGGAPAKKPRQTSPQRSRPMPPPMTVIKTGVVRGESYSLGWAHADSPSILGGSKAASISVDQIIAANINFFGSMKTRQTRTHAYVAGKKITERELRDSKDLASLLMLGL